MLADYANDRTDSFANAFEQYNSDPNAGGIDLTFQGLGEQTNVGVDILGLIDNNKKENEDVLEFN
jgi:hypothetical protein